MKKKNTKLGLSKETLQEMNPAESHLVAGGSRWRTCNCPVDLSQVVGTCNCA